jgi:hypothetical protein
MRSMILLAFVTLVGCGGGSSGKAPSNSTDGGVDGSDAGNNETVGDTSVGTDVTTDVFVPTDHGYILGPLMDDQALVAVPASYAGFPPRPMTSALYTPGASRFFSNTKGDFFLLGIPYATNLDLSTENGVLHKYNSDLKLQWSTSLPVADGFLGINGNTLVATAADDFYFGGLTQSSIPNADSATFSFTVGKLNSDGTLDWMKSWGNSPTDVNMAPQADVDATTVTIDGALIAVGRLYDETPKTPKAIGFWMTRYEPDGTATFLKQYLCADFNNEPTCYVSGDNKLFVDGSGDVVMISAGSDLRKFDPKNGTMISISPLGGLDQFIASNATYFGVSADMNGFYSWSTIDDGFYCIQEHFPTGCTSGLGKYNADGSLLWYRFGEPPRMTVDAATSKSWIGTITGSVIGENDSVHVLKDSLYLTGYYQNSYTAADFDSTTGSNPNGYPMYVGRYDLNGDRVWFQELTLGDVSKNGTLPYIVSIELDSTDNPVIAVSGGYLFKLNATDGSLM